MERAVQDEERMYTVFCGLQRLPEAALLETGSQINDGLYKAFISWIVVEAVSRLPAQRRPHPRQLECHTFRRHQQHSAANPRALHRWRCRAQQTVELQVACRAGPSSRVVPDAIVLQTARYLQGRSIHNRLMPAEDVAEYAAVTISVVACVDMTR